MDNFFVMCDKGQSATREEEKRKTPLLTCFTLSAHVWFLYFYIFYVGLHVLYEFPVFGAILEIMVFSLVCSLACKNPRGTPITCYLPWEPVTIFSLWSGSSW